MQNNSYQVMSGDLSEIKESILASLAYFDMFDYPLSKVEIFFFMNNKYNYEDYIGVLENLLTDGTIHQFGRFYTLKDDHYIVVRRKEGNKKAEEMIKIAKKVGKLLIKFPYVRGIAISGSLSKNFADEFSDIDLFIITERNRLWIARTIMHCFKKLTFLVKKEHLFCMNYYIDMEQLEIPEKNLYTAIEVCTLIPLQSDFIFEQFYTANAWTKSFLPNKNMRVSISEPMKETKLKNLFERLLNNSLGDMIDTQLMKITSNRWRKKNDR